MQRKSNRKLNGLILLVMSIVLVALAAALIVDTVNQNSYWTLNINAPAGWNVTPNGTIQVPTSQNGVNITVTDVPFGASGCWRLDGSTYSNGLEGQVFISKQAAGSNHTLDALWIQPTPQIQPITKGETTIKAGSYQAYNFTITPDMKAWISGDVNASLWMNVYVLNEGNFMRWKSGQTADYNLHVNSVTNYVFDNIGLPAGNVCYLVFDNTDNSEACTVNSDVNLLYLHNGISIQT